MLARPFSGAPARYNWLYGQRLAEMDGRFLRRALSRYGRGVPGHVLLVGASVETARTLAAGGAQVRVHDPDEHRVATLLADTVQVPMVSAHTVALTAALHAGRGGPMNHGIGLAYAPRAILAHAQTPQAAIQHLSAVRDVLLPGGLYIVEVWHPRLIRSSLAAPVSYRLHRRGDAPPGRARFSFMPPAAPRSPVAYQVHVDDETGRALCDTHGEAWLWTVPMWRRIIQRVDGLEEAAILGDLAITAGYAPDRGSRLVWVLQRT